MLPGKTPNKPAPPRPRTPAPLQRPQRTPGTQPTPGPSEPQPVGLGQHAQQLLRGTPPPLSRSSTQPRSPHSTSISISTSTGNTPRRSVLMGGPLGQSKAAAQKARAPIALKKLFEGDPPLVKSKPVAGRLQYRWTGESPPESLAADIATVCRFWLERPETHADALALLDAVHEKSRAPETWYSLLSDCGDTLVQAAQDMTPLKLLTWLQRLHHWARWAQQTQMSDSAAQALRWGQALVQCLGPATHGPALKAVQRLQRWEAEAAEQLPRLRLHAPDTASQPPQGPAQAMPPRPAGPLCLCLLRAHSRNNWRPFITALQARRDLRHGVGVPQDLIDDIDHSLRELLQILDDPSLTPAQISELLHAAYPLVGSPPEDRLLTRDYIQAIGQHLTPQDAERLLLTRGEPLHSLPPGHPLRRRFQHVQDLMGWGLSRPVAQRLSADDGYLWAERLLLKPMPSTRQPAPLPRIARHEPPDAIGFSVQPGPPFTDAEIDAVLTLAEAWSDDAREQGLKLLRATVDLAQLDEPHEDAELNTRWVKLVRKLTQRSDFEEWLGVQRGFDPQTGRLGEFKCLIDTAKAARASAADKRLAAQRLFAWVEQQMHSPQGTAWPALQALLQSMDKAFGASPMFGFEQWLAMALWELERTGDAEPLRLMQPHLADEPMSSATVLKLLRVLQRTWPDELVCMTTLQVLGTRFLTPRSDSLATAELHAAYLRAVLVRSDDELRHSLVQRYLAQYPFEAEESSGDLLQQLVLLHSPLAPTASGVWNLLMELTPPDAPAAWHLWCGLCQSLLPWIAGQLLPAGHTGAAGPALLRRTLEAVWNLSRSPQGSAGQAERQQFELLTALSDRLPGHERLVLLRQLDTACADWAQSTYPSSALPLPSWLMALRAGLQALIQDQGGNLPADAATVATAPTPLGFFRGWFGARLLARRGELQAAREQAQGLRQRYGTDHGADVSGPTGRVITEMLKGPGLADDAT